MKTALAVFVLALSIYALAQNPPEASPALSVSQAIALKGVDDEEKSLQLQYQTDEGKRNAIAQEFTQQHPGWTIGRNNEPAKIAASPTAPQAEPKK